MDDNEGQQLASAREQQAPPIDLEDLQDEDVEEMTSKPVTSEIFREYVSKKQDCLINMTVLPLFLGIMKEEDNYVPKSLVVNFNQPNSPLIHNMINKLAGNPLQLDDNMMNEEQHFNLTVMDMFLYNAKYGKVEKDAQTKVRNTFTKISKCQICMCLNIL